MSLNSSSCGNLKIQLKPIGQESLSHYNMTVSNYAMFQVFFQMILIYFASWAKNSEIHQIQRNLYEEGGLVIDFADDSFMSDDQRPL